jgi:hypothetical protein
MKWAAHMVLMTDRRGPYSVLLGNVRVRDHLKDLGVDGRIILKWVLKKLGGCCGR